MKLSEKGKEFIWNEEGKILNKNNGNHRAYKCQAGYWTIGYGNRWLIDGTAVHEGLEITEAQAVELFEQSLSRYYAKPLDDWIKKYNLELKQNEYDALISLIWNTGSGIIGKYHLFKNLILKVPASENYKNFYLGWEGKMQYQRRKRESEMFLNGKYILIKFK